MAAWEKAPIIKPASGGEAWASAPVVFDIAEAPPSAPRDYDPTPAGGAPEGFHEIRTNGKPYIVHDTGVSDIINSLGDLPGVGMAERMGQGAVRLAGKAASGIAGLFGADPKEIQQHVNEATELPPSRDPLVTAAGAVGDVARKAAAPVDRAVASLPPGPRTAIEGVEEAAPDVLSLVGGLGTNLAGRAGESATNIARSGPEVAEAAGYTGLRHRGDLLAPGNQSVTDTLISHDAGMVPGQALSIAALRNGINVGPARVYADVEASIPPQLTMHGDPLEHELTNLPKQVSQLPRSPDVEALQETMLAKPEFTRDELFANIREARERAKAHWKSDDPDKAALGDAYHALAGAYEDFAGRKLEEAGASTSLADWQAARTQMAKNYQAQGALRGDHFDARVFGQIAERNPGLLTGNAAIVGHVANRLPPAAHAGVGLGDIAPTALGVGAGELAGHAAGVPVLGGVAGALAGPMIRAKLHELATRGNPEAAARTATNPALSYFFDQGRMPPGWNRAPSSPLPSPFGGYLPAPDMVNAGGGASTASTLESLGLTPDVQAAGAAHPGAARLTALREQLSRPPMEEVPFQGPQKWGDFSIAPSAAPAAAPEGIPFENVLEQGGTDKPPVGAPKTSYRPPAKSPKQPSMRTPSEAPELTTAAPAGASAAQQAFRNKQAAARLRKIAGDLRLEGPGGATGDAAERLRAALQRRERGYADGGEVPRGSSSPGSPGVSGALRDALAALKKRLVDIPRREIQAEREQRENSVIDDTNTTARPAPAQSDDYARGGGVRRYAKGGRVKEATRVRPIQEFPRDERGLFIEPDALTKEVVVQIEHNRQRAANKAYYADKHCGLQKGYDPNGKNPCGDCNQADGEICLLVEDDLLPKLKNGRFPPLVIDRRKGSCGPWEIIDPNDPEQRGNRIPASIAGYGVRKGGGPDDAFGCHACWKRRKSKHPALLDRTDWCGEWGTTVEPNACCIVNGAPTEERKH